MRNLMAKDIFPAIRMIQKIGIKDELVKIVEMQNDEKASDADVLVLILAKASENETEKEVWKFLNRLTDDKENLENQDLFEFLDEIVRVASIRKWKDFFTSVAKLMKSQK